MVTDDSITHVCDIKENKYSSLNTGDFFLSKAEYLCQQTYYDVNSEIHKSIAEVCSGDSDRRNNPGNAENTQDIQNI